MAGLHTTYDILELGVEDNDPEKDSKFLVVVDKDEDETYDIPPKAPIFHNIYCGSDKQFE